MRSASQHILIASIWICSLIMVSESAVTHPPAEIQVSLAERVWPRTRNFIAGLTSGIALVLAGHPFDTVKVRMQTSAAGQFRGPMDVLRQTVGKEGFLGLYKGVTPPLLMTGFINAALFGLQGIAVQSIKGMSGPEAANRPTTVIDTMQAAVLTGFAISFIVQPMEAVKARLQVQYAAGGVGAYTGASDCLRRVVSTLGVRRGLYRGWSMTALCRMSNYAYFGPYEYFRQRFGMTSGGSGDRSLAASLLASVACGSLSGVCYWLSCYPLDVVKNRLQSAPDVSPPLYKNAAAAAAAVYKAKGLRGFAAGLTPCLLRAIPANAAAFATFELTMALLPSSLPGAAGGRPPAAQPSSAAPKGPPAAAR